jgi:hypothetical protein
MSIMDELIAKQNAIKFSIFDNLSKFLCNSSENDWKIIKIIKLTLNELIGLISGLFFRIFLSFDRTFNLYLCFIFMLTSIQPILTGI